MSNFNGQWKLRKAGGEAYEPAILFEFDNSHFKYEYGTKFIGQYRLYGKQIELGCVSKRMMSYELPPDHFFEPVFQNVTNWIQDGDLLLFKDHSGKIVVQFTKNN